MLFLRAADTARPPSLALQLPGGQQPCRAISIRRSSTTLSATPAFTSTWCSSAGRSSSMSATSGPIRVQGLAGDRRFRQPPAHGPFRRLRVDRSGQALAEWDCRELQDGKTSPAYIVAEQDIINRDALQKFGACVGPTLAPFKAKVLVRGGKTNVVQRDPPKRIVIFQFESVAVAQNW